MLRRLPCQLACVLFLLGAPAQASDDALAGPLERLAASLDRLAAAVEKQASASKDARAAQRVEVAIGILGLRTRKVDRLEAEIRQLGNEGDDLKSQLAVMKGQLEEGDERRRQEARETTAEEREVRQQMDRGLALAEGRVRTLEERKSALQAELDAELRGLSRLEAMLEDWLKDQP